MWNALAGFGGLVSVGQQVFFGLGAYFTIRLADAGIDPFAALSSRRRSASALFSLPLSLFMLRLRGGEFAIGMWVIAELTHLLVNLDRLIQGETGTSLISLNAYEADDAPRDDLLAGAGRDDRAARACCSCVLRSRAGAAIQAIRDNEEAAASVGVRVVGTKRLLFVLAAFGIGMAGALWLATAVTFQPKTYFSVQWTAYMIFMVLVGGIGRFEGAILGAIIFFLIETWFGGDRRLVPDRARRDRAGLLAAVAARPVGRYRAALRSPAAAGRLPAGAVAERRGRCAPRTTLPGIQPRGSESA